MVELLSRQRGWKREERSMLGARRSATTIDERRR